MKFSKVVVVAVLALNVAFTVAVLFVCLKGGAVPDSLIGAWFGSTTGELGLIAWVKKIKFRKENTNNER